MKPDIEKRVIKHGMDLNRMFNLSKDPVSLCRMVRRLEAEAHRYTEHYCNAGEQNDAFEERVLSYLDSLLHFRSQNIPVFLNLDARGYALKIESEYCVQRSIYRDWGGYGIIAPDLSE